MNCSTPGLPVHHQLSEFTQTHVHWVSDTIQPSHPLSSLSPPALNLSQDQGLFKWVSPLHQVAKILDHELLIVKLRLKLKKVGKTTRPFRYDLNQIPYDYTVDVRNRFKGLDLIDRVPDELLMEVRDMVQETDQDHPHGKEMQKSKMALWGGLTNSCEKKSEKQRRKGKICPF